MSIMSRPSSTNAECSRDCFACIDCDLGWAVGRRGGGGAGRANNWHKVSHGQTQSLYWSRNFHLQAAVVALQSMGPGHANEGDCFRYAKTLPSLLLIMCC